MIDGFLVWYFALLIIKVEQQIITRMHYIWYLLNRSEATDYIQFCFKPCSINVKSCKALRLTDRSSLICETATSSSQLNSQLFFSNFRSSVMCLDPNTDPQLSSLTFPQLLSIQIAWQIYIKAQRENPNKKKLAKMKKVQNKKRIYVIPCLIWRDYKNTCTHTFIYT